MDGRDGTIPPKKDDNEKEKAEPHNNLTWVSDPSRFSGFQEKDGQKPLFMEEILHHLGCKKRSP